MEADDLPLIHPIYFDSRYEEIRRKTHVYVDTTLFYMQELEEQKKRIKETEIERNKPGGKYRNRVE